MNFLFIYINCLYWPDLTYLGGTAEIKDAPILHAQSAQRVSCLNALTQTSYLKMTETHWYCGPVRVDVSSTTIPGITEYQVGSPDPAFFWPKCSLDRMGQHLVELNLKNVQCCRIPHFPGEIIPVPDCSHCKKNSFCVQLESPHEELVRIARPLFYVAHCKKEFPSL